MEPKISSLLLRRGEGCQILLTPPGVLPERWQQRANVIAQAIENVERKTGIRFNNYIKLDSNPHSTAITPTETEHVRGESGLPEDLNQLRPMLTLPERLITQPQTLQVKELESLFLHEMGHQHYRPVRRQFYAERDVAMAGMAVDSLIESSDRNENRIAAQIGKFYFILGADFEADMKRLKHILQERYGMLGADPLLKTTDEKVASMLLKEMALLHRKERAEPSGLEAYKALPPMPRDFSMISLRLRDCLAMPVDAQDIATYAPQADSMINTLFDVHTLALPRIAAWKQFQRGEELLCDDYAVMHADAPRQAVELLTKVSSEPTPMRFPVGGSTHPNDGKRIRRATELSKRVEAALQLCGSLSAMRGQAEPTAYAGWVHAQAEESLAAIGLGGARRG